MTDPAFVSIPWVQSNLEAPGITVIDGSWHMPATGRDARAEFAERALPGAVFFDIEQVADTSADLPHTCPTPEQFAQAMSAWESEIPILSLSTTLRAYLRPLEFGGYFVYLGTRA